MKRSSFTAVLMLTCLLGVGVSAGAQDTDAVVVSVPFEFVAGGATLPAGDPLDQPGGRVPEDDGRPGLRL